MKKIVIGAAALFFVTPAAALAQPAMYSELTVGGVFPSTLKTVDYAFTYLDDDYSGHGEINYKIGLAAGGEVGVQGLMNGRLRLGVSYDYLKTRVDDVTIAGTINGMAGSETFSKAELSDVGIVLGNQAHIALGNLYFAFPSQDKKIEPYVGFGVGAAFPENAGETFAYAGTAGVRFNVDKRYYMGLRYRYLGMRSITDDLGLEYKTFGGHVTSFVIGAHY